MSAISRTVLLSVAAGLAAAAPAPAATDYPPPSRPARVQATPKKATKTRFVCEKNKGHGCFARIQDAIDAARPGDKVVVPAGVYRESLRIVGSSKDRLRLIGDPNTPAKVVLQGGGKRDTAVLVSRADGVTVQGFEAKRYRISGFAVSNARGYALHNVVATRTGAYGVFAFNAVGGTIADSAASENSDSGFYLGQTQPRAKPVRTMVRSVSAYANARGITGTNVRYVTIAQSLFFNNGAGIVLGAADGQKYAPPEDNVISGNDVFWNNFDYFRGAPFGVRTGAAKDPAFPVGTGILIYGGRSTRVTGNRIFGNYLHGIGMLEALKLREVQAMNLDDNRLTGNSFGFNGMSATPGEDLNNVDIAYDGNGTRNCIGDNKGVQVTIPADQSTFFACPFTGDNDFDEEARNQMTAPAFAADREQHWVKHPHQAIEGFEPLEHYTP